MSTAPKLDGRLYAAASLVRQGVRLADVGCDHGHLICSLAAEGRITGGVACDVNPKPLTKAEEQIRRLGLSDRLVCRLADGLALVRSDEADDVVIAGMGGELIADILKNCCWRHDPDKHFLLQPMTRAAHLRRWLLADGFAIEREEACEAAGRYYTVMLARYTGEVKRLPENALFYHVGALAKAPSPQAKQYCLRRAAELQKRADGIAALEPEAAAELTGAAGEILRLIEGW